MPSKVSDLSLIYEGSVKRVFKPHEEKERLWFEYTDDYSVFDWGKMPDTITDKGRSLAILGAHFFERFSSPECWQELKKSPHLSRFKKDWLESRFAHMTYSHVLAKHGCANHYKGLVTQEGKPIAPAEAAKSKEQIFLSVLPVAVVRPEPFTLLGQNVYRYLPADAKAERRLVPLEVVFRFGMPAGSSLKGRLEKTPSYARVLGLDAVPKEGEFFERPVVELFTKLEDKDRLLSVQEALIISGLTPGQFEEMIETSFDLALALYACFAEKGIELWDGKFEFAVDKECGLMLVDSIGPDELRLIYKGVHLSKEMIRQVYRGSSWEKALKEAQAIAASEGSTDWKGICRERLHEEPKNIPAAFKAVIDNLYPVLTNHIAGKKLFAQAPTLDQFVESVNSVHAAKS